MAKIEVRLNPDTPPTGSDLSVVNAARRSFNNRSEWADESECPTDPVHGGKIPPYKRLKEKDKRLIQFLARGMTADDFEELVCSLMASEYLMGEDAIRERLWEWRNTPTHDTPFNHAFISFEVKAPIFVRAQLVKHEYLIMSEFSRRYITDGIEFYLPDRWRTKPEGSVKQGSGTGSLPMPEPQLGFCLNCGGEVYSSVRPQGGGRVKRYCSDTCKYECTNKHRNPYKTVFQNARARVLREGGEWSIDFDNFSFPEYCPYLGYKLDYSYGKGKIQHNSPSFDRIDSTKGYVQGNVEIISSRANSMKNDADRETQVEMAKAVLLMHEGYVVQDDKTYKGHCRKIKELYNSMIEDGYSAEQARMVLPQSTMTEWSWSGTLGAFAKMCQLRLHPDAQYEARLVAKQVYDYLLQYYPVSAKALVEGVDV